MFILTLLILGQYIHWKNKLKGKVSKQLYSVFGFFVHPCAPSPNPNQTFYQVNVIRMMLVSNDCFPPESVADNIDKMKKKKSDFINNHGWGDANFCFSKNWFRISSPVSLPISVLEIGQGSCFN